MIERNDRVGGVWLENGYPGAGVDTPSHLYSYSFAPNPHWSRYFAKQPEILAYLDTLRPASRGAAARPVRHRGGFGPLRPGERHLAGPASGPSAATWTSRATAPPELLVADVVISYQWPAQNRPPRPTHPGPGHLRRARRSTPQRWRHDVESRQARGGDRHRGQRDQVVPAIQPAGGAVRVFQRSPGWTLPRMDFA